MTEPSLPAPRRLADRVEWRLSAHFFRAMFDFGVLSEAGADSLKHLFIGSIGGFVSAAWLMVVIYADKYLVLWFQPSPEPYRRALLGDDMFMLGVPMLVGAFVTLLVSSSLFPDERDFRILGPLPIHRGVVFGAKMAALVLFVGAFIALTDASLLPLFLLTTRNPWGEHVFVGRLAAWLATSAAASAFAILAVAAGVGLLGLLRSSARLQGVTTTAKSLALGLLVLSVPLVVRLSDLGGALADRSPWFLLVPPAWFVGLERVMAGSRDPAFVRLAGRRPDGARRRRRGRRRAVHAALPALRAAGAAAADHVTGWPGLGPPAPPGRLPRLPGGRPLHGRDAAPRRAPPGRAGGPRRVRARPGRQQPDGRRVEGRGAVDAVYADVRVRDRSPVVARAARRASRELDLPHHRGRRHARRPVARR